ncbi:hypothetical protein LEP1GSC083_0043 [Leptospira interrogans serovar Pyrogenes str. L0374]|uniref:Uncharacterized protein n=1 Tax=Leptospira interrogans serovar Pyrogenes str. L0374 TaxID=1049928 RepID=M6KYK3_LEPIR|nr:hypothetical protein LEP1GSC083_0043 [Leptospira interrogans serovar Pyrogenes str. L0374]
MRFFSGESTPVILSFLVRDFFLFQKVGEVCELDVRSRGESRLSLDR